jgi:hypothetical protein
MPINNMGLDGDDPPLTLSKQDPRLNGLFDPARVERRRILRELTKAAYADEPPMKEHFVSPRVVTSSASAILEEMHQQGEVKEPNVDGQLEEGWTPND